MKTVPVNTGGDHILMTVNAYPSCRAGVNSDCLANAFLLFFQSSALAVPPFLQCHGPTVGNRVKEQSHLVTALFKLASSVEFIFLFPNPKIALPKFFFQQINTISNQGTAANYGSDAAHLREKNSAESNPAHTWVHFGPLQGLSSSGKVEYG